MLVCVGGEPGCVGEGQRMWAGLGTHELGLGLGGIAEGRETA